MRFLLASLLVLLACDGGPFGPTDRVALARAEARWAQRGFADYAFETRGACFCPIEHSLWARVEVRGGQVTSVVVLEGPQVMPPERLREWQTVEQLFAVIRSAGRDPSLARVEATYDDRLGYPLEVGFEIQPGIQDGGGAIFLRGAGPLP